MDEKSFGDQLIAAVGGGSWIPNTAGPANALVWAQGHVAVGTRLQATGPEEVVVIIDDSDKTMADPNLPGAWHEWLRLANLLTFADVPVPIATSTMLQGQGRQSALEAQLAQDAVVWAGFQAEGASDLELALAAGLTRAGVEVPDSAFGELNGIPVGFVWERHARVVVLFDAQEGDEEMLGSDWTVIRASEDIAAVVDDVRLALTSRKD